MKPGINRTIATEEWMSEYIFSYYARETTTGIQRRPWWNLFGRDVLVTNSVWRHHTFTLPEDEALLFIPGDNPTMRLLYRVIGNGITNILLEHGPCATPYIKTTSEVPGSLYPKAVPLEDKWHHQKGE